MNLIVLSCIIFSIIDYIRIPEERTQENAASIIRWCIPGIILALLCYSALSDYKRLDIAGKYYRGDCDIVEGIILEHTLGRHYKIMVDNKELHLLEGFAIEKMLPREGEYVRVSYVTGNDTLHIAKIEVLADNKE
jgi:hypothetical protein